MATEEELKVDAEFKRIVTTDLELPRGSKLTKLIVAALVLIAIGVGVWYYMKKRQQKGQEAAEGGSARVESRPGSSTKSPASGVIISSEP